MTAARRTITDDDADAIAEALIAKLGLRRAPRVSDPDSDIEVTETDRARARSIARRLGLPVRETKKR